LRFGPVWEDHDLVFANEIGKPMDAGNLIDRSFVPLLRKAELPRIRFHDLRHTFATLMLLQGVHVKVVSEMLGHSSIALTLLHLRCCQNCCQMVLSGEVATHNCLILKIPPAGFEPATLGLEVRCSIQLS
jgi:site-specific recombinase XerD